MADWYVDANISGGNGTHPATAYPSITSVVWAAGDRAWVRRTHYETLLDSVYVGPASFNHAQFSRVGFLIGWPDSGDPFFNERPAAGVSSNWDADVPSTSVYSVYGLKFPTLNNSNASATLGMQLRPGLIACNLAFQNSGGGTFLAFRNAVDFSNIIVDNTIFLHNGNPLNRIAQDMNMRFGKVTLVLSGSGGGNGFLDEGYIDHVVFHELSVYSGALIRGLSLFQSIGTMEFRTSSIDAIATQLSAFQDDANASIATMTIRRMCGTQPYSGAILRGGLNGHPMIRVDDYFGLGPRIIGGCKPSFFMTASVDAMHDDRRAVRYEVFSEAATNQRYFSPLWRSPMIRKPVAVQNGVALTMRMPVYVDSTFVFSPAAGMMKANLMARGAKPVYITASHVLPGTPGEWTGNFAAGGSAYLCEMKFFPEETGTVMLEIYPPHWTQTTSGQGLTAYALFSEPYSV